MTLRALHELLLTERPPPIHQQLFPSLEHHPTPTRCPPVDNNDDLSSALPHRPHELLPFLLRPLVAERKRTQRDRLLPRIGERRRWRNLELRKGRARRRDRQLMRPRVELPSSSLLRPDFFPLHDHPRRNGSEDRTRELNHAPRRIEPDVLARDAVLPRRAPNGLKRPRGAARPAPEIDDAVWLPVGGEAEAGSGGGEGVEGCAVDRRHEAREVGERGGGVVRRRKRLAVPVGGWWRQDGGGSAEVGVEVEGLETESGLVVGVCGEGEKRSGQLSTPQSTPSGKTYHQ